MTTQHRSLIVSLIATSLTILLTGSAAAQDRKEVMPSMKVLFENDRVRVQWHDVKVGEKISMHSHPPSVIIVFNDSKVRFTFPNGTTRVAEGKVGQVHWSNSISHAVENIGDTDVHNLVIEVKGPIPKGHDLRQWPKELLPLAAAPDQHTLRFENERVRVFEVVNPPGGIAPAHVHVWPSVFITVSPARLLFRDSKGNIVADVPGITDADSPTRVQWFGPSTQPRSVENADKVTLRAFRIEFKSDVDR